MQSIINNKVVEVEKTMCARIRRLLFIAVVALVFFVQAPSIVSGQVNPRIVREVRHELVTLPYYGVFDWLEFEVQNNGATVVLKGQVVRPTTKSDAERRVKDIEGVSNVVNEIETLPLSPSDDRLRIALYRQIYGWNSPLFRYAHQAVPSIHLIVNRGHATLKGIVSNRGDANIANIRARSVPGLFSVKNELKVESEEPR